MVNSPFKTAEADYTESSDNLFSHGLDILNNVRASIQNFKALFQYLYLRSLISTLMSPWTAREISTPTVINDSWRKPSLELSPLPDLQWLPSLRRSFLNITGMDILRLTTPPTSSRQRNASPIACKIRVATMVEDLHAENENRSWLRIAPDLPTAKPQPTSKTLLLAFKINCSQHSSVI